tara:strand:- start:263 stop:997 length:735 start_codon:yes stop_codon:yes gene_type:complete
MKKIKLTESELTGLITQIILEQSYGGGIIQEGDVPCDIWCKIKSAQRGSRGDVVKMIQHLLARGCGDTGPFNEEKLGGGMNEGCAENWENCDGKFGKETKKAVKEFQENVNMYQQAGLSVDGKVGFNTLTALCSVCYGTASPKDAAEYILCKKQCQCDQQEDTPGGDGIQDVIDSIEKDDNHNCEGDGGCNEEWILDNWDNVLDGMSDDCDRIKACLYYASLKDNESWHHFLSCMRGKFGTATY